MKAYKDFIKEANVSRMDAEPKSPDEKRFKDKHVVQVTDYVVPGTSDVLNAKTMDKDMSKAASYHSGEDEKVYEELSIDEISADKADAAATERRKRMNKALDAGDLEKAGRESDKMKKNVGHMIKKVGQGIRNEEVNLDEMVKPSNTANPAAHKKAAAYHIGQANNHKEALKKPGMETSFYNDHRAAHKAHMAAADSHTGAMKVHKTAGPGEQNRIMDRTVMANKKSEAAKSASQTAMNESSVYEEVDYNTAYNKMKRMKKGASVSFTHAQTGQKVTGTYGGLRNMGGRSYAHVQHKDGATRVPVTQIHQVK